MVEEGSSHVIAIQYSCFTASTISRGAHPSAITREEDGITYSVSPPVKAKTSQFSKGFVLDAVDLGEKSLNSDFLNLVDVSYNSSCVVVESGTQAMTTGTQKENAKPGYDDEQVEQDQLQAGDVVSRDIRKQRRLFRKLNHECVTELRGMIGAIESEGLFAAVPTDNGGIIHIKGKDIKRLFKDGVWLNDGIINFVAVHNKPLQ